MCEEYNPIPMRSTSNGKKSSFNFSPGNMPLSQNPPSIKRLPNSGNNLLPALAMLPKESAQPLMKDLSLSQKREVEFYMSNPKQLS